MGIPGIYYSCKHFPDNTYKKCFPLRLMTLQKQDAEIIVGS